MESASTLRPVCERILQLLKTRGEATAADLGQRLGVTGEAVRQQLVKLQAGGFVEPRSYAKGRGRPSQFWRLTRLGHCRFPDAHAELTAKLLETIRTTLGEPALDLLITAREKDTKETYEAALNGLSSIEERLNQLAELRTREGYMAEWRVADDGQGWLLVENHCPICAAATACQGFCRSELAVFRMVLGPDVIVERTDHLLAGATRCAYLIRPAK